MSVRIARPPAWLIRWFDNHAATSRAPERNADRVDWLRCLPFLGMHVACLAVIWVGWSGAALATAAALYFIRMFAITAFYHRYFSHRAFKTSRALQTAMALIGCGAAQRDPLWWAGHHAHHHAHADDPEDPHSPARLGFWRSHVGWFMTPAAFPTRENYVRDWLRFPELRWLNRFDLAPPVLLGAATFYFGAALKRWAPSLGTDGPQMLVWGFFVSTVVLYHATFTVNSLAHGRGSRRYRTRDDSRNNAWLALLTLGEGWHNNHHHYPGAARQGFFSWEIDLAYYGLRLMEGLGLVWDLREVPENALRSRLIEREA